MLAICLHSELLKYLFPQPGEEGQISEKITAFLWQHISEKKKNTDINQTVQLSGFLVSKETVVLRRWERKIKKMVLLIIITLLTFQLWLFKVNYKFKVYLQIKISIKDGKSYFKNSLSSLLKSPISFTSQTWIGEGFHSRMPR